MSRIGLEIGSDTLRAVRAERGEMRTFEVEWDPDVPGPAVAALLDSLGPTRAVAAAIDGSLLRVRRIDLPPLPLAERRRALEMEPDRHFAVPDEPLAFSLPGDRDVVFAVPRRRLQAWLDALASLGPIARVEPSATAVGRALAALAGPPDADLLRHGLNGGVDWWAFRDGRLRSARHVFGDLATAAAAVGEAAGAGGGPWAPPAEADVAPEAEDAAGEEAGRAPEQADPAVGEPGVATEPDRRVPLLVDPWPDPPPDETLGRAAAPLPTPDGLAAPFLAAWGATLEPEADWEEGFVIESLQRDLSRRRALRTAGAVLALAVALVFAVASWGAYRERVEGRLDERIAAAQGAAEPVIALQAEVNALRSALAALERVEASRTDVLGGFRALTDAIPPDTWLRAVHVAGPDWQIDGIGADAAALIPLLEGSPAFEDVRFVSATSRVQRDNTTYDDFSLAFRTTGPADRP